jgi:hypothetical protein
MAEDRAPPDAIAVALRVGEAIESVGDALGDDFEVDVDMLRDSSSRARRTLSSESCSGTSRGEASRNGSGATSSKSFA